jgi:hypothetical protein
VNGFIEPAPRGEISDGQRYLGVQVAQTAQATGDLVQRVSGERAGSFYLRA